MRCVLQAFVLIRSSANHDDLRLLVDDRDGLRLFSTGLMTACSVRYDFFESPECSNY